MRNLILKGVRQNNLKKIDLEIPLGRKVVVTGPSGSGKSSLAFETVYAEGQRRYMQSLSTYARQFLERFQAPLADKISNIPPTIALEQINPVRNSRATVGTTTEIYDYFRLLFEKIGVQYCDKCAIPMVRQSTETLKAKIWKDFSKEAFLLLTFKSEVPKKTDLASAYFSDLIQSGYSRALVKAKLIRLQEIQEDKKLLGTSIYIVTDRIALDPLRKAESELRFVESLNVSWELGQGESTVFVEGKDKYKEALVLYRGIRCEKCGNQSTPKTSISFSFNSPLGACSNCKGFGNTLEVDEELVIPNRGLSLIRGAIDPFMKPSLLKWHKKLIEFCKKNRIDLDLPYNDLPEKYQKALFEGTKGFIGVKGVFKMLEEEKYKMRIRVFINRYLSPRRCEVCEGRRINSAGLLVKVGGLNIAEVAELSIEQSQSFFGKLSLDKSEKKITEELLSQIKRRLFLLNSVGLGYLTLNRLTRSLSGGEYQRILLSTQLSQGLVDTLYVLDEPSIGLHPRDTKQLLEVLSNLHSQGNSLLVVEHDPEVIEWAEHIVDLGPGSGTRGGEVIYSGGIKEFTHSAGRTAKSLAHWKENCLADLEKEKKKPGDLWLTLRGATANNLKKIEVSLPLGRLICVTGVSGSGKSTLIVDTLYQALAKVFHGKSEKLAPFESISGFENLDGIELIDQSPVGKSSRSNPITFIKGYDEVRRLFSQTQQAMEQHLFPSHFSFNTPGGRCETCQGEGRIKIDMVFMEDVWVPCQECREKRFRPEVLAVQYKGKSIDECLRMTVDDAYTFFKDSSSLRTKLALLIEVGLGYLQLGQPSYTLSGGEAQRLKIARELTSGALGLDRGKLFILDEPTTGLHFSEVEKLLGILRSLVSKRNTVIVIEHNTQLICAADYLVDMGPEGGDKGGFVVDLGTPKDIATRQLSPTGKYLHSLQKVPTSF